MISAVPRVEYFAEKAHNAMKGLGTDDSTLIRVITTRYGVDLIQIKEAFQQKYKKSLSEWIHSETSGDYRTAILSIVNRTV